MHLTLPTGTEMLRGGRRNVPQQRKGGVNRNKKKEQNPPKKGPTIGNNSCTDLLRAATFTSAIASRLKLLFVRQVAKKISKCFKAIAHFEMEDAELVPVPDSAFYHNPKNGKKTRAEPVWRCFRFEKKWRISAKKSFNCDGQATIKWISLQ